MKLSSREIELEKIERFSDFTKIMFYRTNLLIHSNRIYEIVKYINNFFSDSAYDKKIALNFALMHDDQEIVTGDIMSYDKQNFSEKEKKLFNLDCENANKVLIKNYEKEFNNCYRKLLEMEKQENSIEFFIVKFADKIDSHCEVCHEILAGNKEFIKKFKVNNEQSDPYNFTFKKLLIKSFSDLNKKVNLKDNKCPLFNFQKTYDSKFYKKVENGKLHTLDSISKETGYLIYDIWKEITLKSNNKILINSLLNQKEKTPRQGFEP